MVPKHVPKIHYMIFEVFFMKKVCILFKICFLRKIGLFKIGTLKIYFFNIFKTLTEIIKFGMPYKF